MKALTKTGNKNLTSPGAPAAPTVKTIILDTHDGCFTDASVKVRPHKTDPNKVVLKCVNAQRLAKAVVAMGLTACGPVIKGHKHFMVFCWKAQVGAKLFGNSPMANALAAGSGKMLQLPKGEVITVKGGK